MKARLSCVILFLAACGGETGAYVPPDGPEADLAADQPGVDAGGELVDYDIPPIPDISGVALESANDLLVRLVPQGALAGPSWAVSTGDVTGAMPTTIVLSGFVKGSYESLTVTTDRGFSKTVEGGDEGAKPFSYFQVPGVELAGPAAVGDVFESRPTRVWVTVTSGDRKAADSGIVMVNPGVVFPRPLYATPATAFADQPVDVVFTLDLNLVENFDPAAVVLMETDASCATKVGLGTNMVDDGNLTANGDEIPQDRVYTRRLKLQPGPAGIRLFRAAVTAQSQGKTLVAYSPCVSVRTVLPISQAQCEQGQAEVELAGSIYDAVLQSGSDEQVARRSVVAYLRSRPSVLEAGAREDAHGVWVVFDSGMLAVVEPGKVTEGLKVALWDEIGDAPAAKATPWSRDVVHAASEVEGGALAKWLSNLSCPPIRPLPLESGSLGLLRRVADAGLVFLSLGGGPVFGGLSDEYRAGRGFATSATEDVWPSWAGWDSAGAQDVAWTSQHLECGKLFSAVESCYYEQNGTCCISCPYDPEAPDFGQSTWETCPEHLDCLVTHAGETGIPIGTLYDAVHDDLASQRTVVGRGGRLGILPSFVANYGAYDLGNPLVFLGYPWSMVGGAMAAEFLAGGANAVVGARDGVGPVEAEGSGASLLAQLVKDKVTPSQLVPGLAAQQSGKWRLMGSGSLDLAFSQLINADFGTGSLRGWRHTGDARILARWCGMEPASKYMALVSTGLGYTVQTGEIRQEFCIPGGTVQVEANFDFISHEFVDQCGTDYDDKVELYISDEKEGSLVPLVSAHESPFASVNDFCPPDGGSCPPCDTPPDCVCGSLYPSLEPWPDECSVESSDEDGAFHTGWRHALPVNISGLSGPDKPVTFVIRAEDAGSVGLTTTVLVDSILLN